MIILRSRRNQNHIITSSHHHIITCQISKSPLSAASVARSGAGAGAGGSAALDAAKEEEEEEEEKEEEEDAAEESGSWAWPAEGSWDRAARSFIAATSLGVCGSSALSSDDDVAVVAVCAAALLPPSVGSWAPEAAGAAPKEDGDAVNSLKSESWLSPWPRGEPCASTESTAPAPCSKGCADDRADAPCPPPLEALGPSEYSRKSVSLWLSF